MSKSLQAKLKSGDAQVRHAAIEKLAMSQTEEDIDALKRVAQGTRRTSRRYYNFSDQALTLQKLVEMGRTDVNEYLQNFFQEVVHYRNSGLTGDTHTNIPTDGWNEHRFPNAGGAVGKRLPYDSRSDVPWEKGGKQGAGGPKLSIEDERDSMAHTLRAYILGKISK